MTSVPFRDESSGGTVKRTYWPKGDAEAKFREVKRSVKGLRTKRDKPYSREDQKKIASERWGEFCESHPEWRGEK